MLRKNNRVSQELDNIHIVRHMRTGMELSKADNFWNFALLLDLGDLLCINSCSINMLQVPTSLPLAAAPEKGILKKQSLRSTENLPLKTLACGSADSPYSAISDSPYLAALENEYMSIGEPSQVYF